MKKVMKVNKKKIYAKRAVIFFLIFMFIGLVIASPKIIACVDKLKSKCIALAKQPYMEAYQYLQEKKERKVKEVKNDVLEHDYSLYLDGAEVDINNLNLYDYSITIDDAKRKVFLTK